MCCQDPSQCERIARNGREMSMCGFVLRCSGMELFNTQTIQVYMQNVQLLFSQLPVYSQLAKIYTESELGSFESPDVDYYRLQFLNRYRFSCVKRQEPCNCSVCAVLPCCISLTHRALWRSDRREDCRNSPDFSRNGFVSNSVC